MKQFSCIPAKLTGRRLLIDEYVIYRNDPIRRYCKTLDSHFYDGFEEDLNYLCKVEDAFNAYRDNHEFKEKKFYEEQLGFNSMRYEVVIMCAYHVIEGLMYREKDVISPDWLRDELGWVFDLK